MPWQRLCTEAACCGYCWQCEKKEQNPHNFWKLVVLHTYRIQSNLQKRPRPPRAALARPTLEFQSMHAIQRMNDARAQVERAQRAAQLVQLRLDLLPLRRSHGPHSASRLRHHLWRHQTKTARRWHHLATDAATTAYPHSAGSSTQQTVRTPTHTTACSFCSMRKWSARARRQCCQTIRRMHSPWRCTEEVAT